MTHEQARILAYSLLDACHRRLQRDLDTFARDFVLFQSEGLRNLDDANGVRSNRWPWAVADFLIEWGNALKGDGDERKE